MRSFYRSGQTLPYAFRKKQLVLLRHAVKEHEAEIAHALFADLKKSKEESYLTETGIVLKEISFALKHLKRWMKEEHAATPAALFYSKSRILHDPFGICLIISPWNYPLQLSLSPLIGAIAAGNCAVVKPSEFSPHTSAVLKKIIASIYPQHYITVTCGSGEKVIPELFEQIKPDYVFYTGSTETGKKIAAMCAGHLIPYTLELGGKSPCVVDKTADIKTAAKRIAWGKFTNAGQTCIAPDYVLVHQDVKEAFVTELKAAVKKMFGPDATASNDYGRMINTKHFNRIKSYLREGTIACGGGTSEEQRYIEPTILFPSTTETTVMQEEIFGPVLPVIAYGSPEEAASVISKNANPLALYVFSESQSVQDFFLRLPFGGGCINNTLVHVGNVHLPFGGVGNSGQGQYHGRFSFYTFSRPKAIVKTANWIDPSLKYPPYSGKLGIFKRLFR